MKFRVLYVLLIILPTVSTSSASSRQDFGTTDGPPVRTDGRYPTVIHGGSPGSRYTKVDSLRLTGAMGQTAAGYRLVPGSDHDIEESTSVVPPGELLPPRPDGFSSISPNPFNPRVQISFLVNRNSMTRLDIYDLRGKLVKRLVAQTLPGGKKYTFTWDGTDRLGRDLGSGVYLARLRIGDSTTQVRKLMMLK